MLHTRKKQSRCQKAVHDLVQQNGTWLPWKKRQIHVSAVLSVKIVISVGGCWHSCRFWRGKTPFTGVRVCEETMPDIF